VAARSHRPAGAHGHDPSQRCGSQYTSIRFTETLALQGLSASIGSVGDAYDNAAAESTIGLYKNEAIAADSPFRSGPLRTLGDVETITINYVDWYNNQRLHSLLDNTTPDEHEQAYYASSTGPPSGDAANKKPA
jgi:transposase InsO family protein